MKKELLKIAEGLKIAVKTIESKIEWNETDLSDELQDINEYIKDLENIAQTIPDLDDLKAIDEYQRQAENLIENAINKELEDND
jgi:hypothetical protein